MDEESLLQVKVIEQEGSKIIGVWKDINVQLLEIKQLDSFFEIFTKLSKRVHSNVAQLFGVTKEDGRYFSVSEFTPKGVLFDILHDSKKELSWNIRLNFILDISKGLYFIHQLKLIHGDLRSANIILDENWKAKIIKSDVPKITRWSSPEFMNAGSNISFKSDIFSFGMIIWEILTRKLPYSNFQNENRILDWISLGNREQIPNDCPPEISSIISHSWKSKPEDRPDSSQILEKITQIQFNQLQQLSNLYSIKEIEEESPIPGKYYYEQGKKLWDIGKNGDAFPFFKEAAKLGNLNACLRLAHSTQKKSNREMYEKRVRAGVSWFKKQAEKKDPHAMYNLAICYEIGYCEINHSKAMQLYFETGLMGYGRGWYAFGKLYEYDEKYDKAIQYMRIGMEHGVILATTSIGYLYDVGHGVSRNREEAVKYYRIAAEQGDYVAQHNLGLCYQMGEGVPKDLELAKYWYAKAAAFKDPDACYKLALLYHKSPLEEEKKKVKKLLERSAARGNTNAEEYLKQNFPENKN